MPYCVVYNCRSNSKFDKTLSWFRFPNSEKDNARFRAWVHYCRRKDFNPSTHSRLCSKHFDTPQYSRDPAALALYGYVGAKPALKEDAVPDVPWTKDDGQSKDTSATPNAERQGQLSIKTPRTAVMKRRRLEVLQEAMESHSDTGNESEVAECVSPVITQDDSSPSLQVTNMDDKGSQANIHPQTRTRRIQVGRSKVSCTTQDFSVQCSIVEDLKLNCFCAPADLDTSILDNSDPADELDDSFLSFDERRSEVEDVDSDFDYSDDEAEMTDSDDESIDGDGDEINNYRLEATDNISEEKFYVVSESSLSLLFAKCRTCNGTSSAFIDHSKGTMISVTTMCVNGHSHNWTSQPVHCKLPCFNLLLSSAILTSGCNTAKLLRCLEQSKVKCMSPGSVYRLQRLYTIPATITEFEHQQSQVLDMLRAKSHITLGGDGRCDSPGYSAKYGSYTLMDLETNKIVDIQLVQSNEVGGSTHMELEGLKRGLTHLDTAGIKVADLVTDRHVMIKSYMKKEKADVNHYFDVWHVAKGISKKLETAAKRRGGEEIRTWIRSIVNHCYWVAATSTGNKDLVLDKWKSLCNHIANVHCHNSTLFPRCIHEDLSEEDDREWMKEGSRCHKMVKEVVESNYLLRDLPQLSPRHQTYGLEVFHSIVNSFAPKSTHFFHSTMLARLYIAALHFNENGNRIQAKRSDGKEIWKLSYPKAKKGAACVVKKQKIPPTYGYVDLLLNRTIKHRTDFPTLDLARANVNKFRGTQPEPVTSTFPKFNKDELIRRQKSRYV